ncbi:MAG: glycosyltransferase family 4 protein [Bacteroidales bacterium]|nr:glycosyltransferase family 4 protein [Bacteroidales bacterium]
MMRKALIITYYWPPSGGSAVLRWLKFAKYLREFGWEPVIYTPENPEAQEIDESLLKDIPEGMEILKTRIVEPYGMYKWLTGKKKHERIAVALISEKKQAGILSRLFLWIRSNLFIPDPRVGWVNPSVRNLSRYLKDNPVDVVITTGPPQSMHLIGLKLKNKLGVKWVADFRDPWTNVDFYRELLLTKYADSRQKMLEKSVLENADQVISVSPGMTAEFISMGVKNVTTITNGFDTPTAIPEAPGNGKFTLVHLGSMPKSRNPENLWQVLSQLTQQDERFAQSLEIKLIGKIDQSITESLEQLQLLRYVARESFVPHEQTYSILAEAAVLLLCINNTPNAKGILTNKFFEYLSAKRPIVAIGPRDGDAATILDETQAGKIFSYDDTVILKNHLVALFDLYSQGKLQVSGSGIEKYSRKNLTHQLSELLNHLVS